MTDERRGADGPADPPPFWGKWGRIYLFVAGLLLAQVIAYFALTRWTS